MSKQNWDTQHLKYVSTDWIDKPSIFAQKAVKFFPKTGKVLDVGCGQGQDPRFFVEHGYEVIGIDFSDQGIKIAKEKSKGIKIEFRVMDIAELLPFSDEYFDIVYSHLAIHYFDKLRTKSIFNELSRILKKGGILAIFVNSINDREYGTGTKVEEDYFLIGNMRKRYFSKESLSSFTNGFETLVLDEEGETYKDRVIGVSGLVRFIGKKL